MGMQSSSPVLSGVQYTFELGGTVDRVGPLKG